MAGNHKEWIEHSENHPNINHLDVTCPWDRLRDSHETKFDQSKNKKVRREAFLSYKDVNTRRRVVLTSITISRNEPLKVVDI